MALIVDSSVFVEAERRGLELPSVVELAEAGEGMYVAAITVAELLLGVHLGDASRQAERQDFIDRVIQDFEVLTFDLAASRIYAEVWANLRRSGQMIGPHDLLIAATALQHGFDILTDNVRHFQRIPGLNVRRPAW